GESVLAPVLSRLRRVIAPATIEGRDAVTLTLPDPVWIDVEVVRDALATARVESDAAAAGAAAREAADRAAPGLLPDLAAGWLVEQRGGLADLRVDALEVAAVRARELDPAAAEAAAREAVALAPFRESARAALI